MPTREVAPLAPSQHLVRRTNLHTTTSAALSHTAALFNRVTRRGDPQPACHQLAMHRIHHHNHDDSQSVSH
jgi:hypothetical protein